MFFKPVQFKKCTSLIVLLALGVVQSASAIHSIAQAHVYCSVHGEQEEAPYSHEASKAGFSSQDSHPPHAHCALASFHNQKQTHTGVTIILSSETPTQVSVSLRSTVLTLTNRHILPPLRGPPA